MLLPVWTPLVMYSISSVFGRVAVQQIFPKNSSYCCPCPSLDLQCEFSDSGTVITVLWSSGSTATQISSDGRMIDNSIISSGMSNLLLYNESFLDATFRCFPLFLNGTLAESNLFTTPELARLTLEYTHEPVSDTSITINWMNPYPECFSFSVLLNDVPVGQGINETNYIITALSPSTMYRVCVVAVDGHGNTREDWRYCNDITTANRDCWCFTVIGILVCIVLPILSCCCCCSCCCCIALLIWLWVRPVYPPCPEEGNDHNCVPQIAMINVRVRSDMQHEEDTPTKKAVRSRHSDEDEEHGRSKEDEEDECSEEDEHKGFKEDDECECSEEDEEHSSTEQDMQVTTGAPESYGIQMKKLKMTRGGPRW